uniref:NADH-ubiquinone oxidoreductase chain 2 n=1 Tax=Omoglymmius wukong TaxID=2983420 RepID=A0A977TLR9_9CARA|nr:NADH dehydrogenase subunit 2 [Omoglymmius wukong]UXW93686.1 NADH dehydrogenase subunit 2 [Omoglymmius wukong]
MIQLYKMIFIFILLISTLISISSYNWLTAWMGLEINLLSFITLISNKNNLYTSESSMKYFLVQSIASSIFLFSILLNMMLINSMEMFSMFSLMMNSALMLKMGMAPFHFWFPDIINYMNWINSMLLMTWQKIAPIMLLSYLMKNSKFIIFTILMSTFIGSIMGLNQIKLQKILAYSSINHLGWMISSFLNNNLLWITYFLVYSIITISITMLFNYLNIFYIKQMFITMNKLFMIKFIISMNFLSLGGLPPFLGFFPKWLIIQELSNYNKFIPLILFMILMSLITLFYYLKMIYSNLMIMNIMINNNFIMNKINIFIISIFSISMNSLFLILMFMNMF